jgi:uncharacterized protein YsxB (DUF464 family)
MIRIDVGCDPAGLVRSLRSEGHDAPGKGGYSLACGLVSHSLRSFARLIGRQTGIILRGELVRPGGFEMTIGDIAAENQLWYRGASELLIQGLREIQADYPGRIELDIHTI